MNQGEAVRSTLTTEHRPPPTVLGIPDWLFLLAICGFFAFWKLAAFGLIGADEPRYAQVAREMLTRHDWITPTLGGNAWLEKPPLYYWQAIIAYRVFGVSDWAARLPSACDATLMILAAYLLLRRLRRGIELEAALIMAACAGTVGYSRAASMDMPLTATFSIAMLAWYAWNETGRRDSLAIFYFCLALGTLAKGPVAPFLAALIISIFAGSQKRLQIATKTLWLPGIALFLAVTLPWYIAVQLRNPQFFHVFILEHNLARFGSNLYHHPEPFWYYIPVILLGWMPWTVLVMTVLVWSLRRFRNESSDQLNTFLAIWMAVVVVFFSVSQSKLPGYVLPAVPAGAVLAAQWLRARVMEKPGVLVAGLHALAVCALLFPALMVSHVLLDPHSLWGRVAIVPLVITIAVGFAVFILLVKFGWRILRVATLAPAIIVVAVVLRFGAAPLNQKLSTRAIAEALAQYDHQHLPIAEFLVPRETEFGLAFYRNQVIPRYEAGSVPQSEHLLVTAEGYSKRMDNAAGRKVVFLENFPAQKLDLFYVPPK